MTQVKVTLNKHHGGLNPGECGVYDPDTARSLIAAGIASPFKTGDVAADQMAEATEALRIDQASLAGAKDMLEQQSKQLSNKAADLEQVGRQLDQRSNQLDEVARKHDERQKALDEREELVAKGEQSVKDDRAALVKERADWEASRDAANKAAQQKAAGNETKTVTPAAGSSEEKKA